MTVLDASAVLALLGDQPGAAEVQALLRDPGSTPVLPATQRAEVVDVRVRRGGDDPAQVQRRLVWLTAAGVVDVPLTADLADEAGRLRARWYHRRSRPLSLADACALATATVQGRALMTGDQDLADAAEGEAVEVLRLRPS